MAAHALSMRPARHKALPANDAVLSILVHDTDETLRRAALARGPPGGSIAGNGRVRPL